ncbi:ribonuclease H-like domain-containing protein [Lactarius quietus]|nr:ribonuclease H-like domain-containing protein [Lactarius quietus]
MQLFIEKWIPGAIIPDRRTLSGHILDREAGKVEDKLKLKLRGRKATFQTDRWKNKAKQAIVATMVSVDFEPYLMRTHDVSVQPKTGDALLQLVIEDIKWSEETYRLTIIAACSDDGGDARKMRCLLLVRMPWLIIILCWAHQINLIVGDYLTLKLPFQDCVPKALKVIKWMNSHSHALGLFRQEQLYMSPKFLALILPVITRWIAHYLSLRRLLTVEKSLKVVWLKHGDTMIATGGSKAEDKAKAIAVQAIINDLHFWYHIKRRLHSRVFRMDVDTNFHAAFMDYFNRHEEFSPESMALVDWADMAKKKEVNPVEIWEGIDTREETGRNRLTILAIHILSVVANSAGCERAFSHMGLVHTGIRSKLGVEKVRKTTMVGMDIKRSHLEAGLVHSRGDDYDDSNEFPPGNTTPVASGSLMITIPPLNLASLSPQAAQHKKTSIPLEILFQYPTDTDLPSEGMNSFWRGGVENLEKEMEAYEILNANEEAFDGIQDEIMATVNDI